MLCLKGGFGYLYGMKNLAFIVLFLVFYALPAHAVQALDPAIEAGFVPHKALYDIRLKKAKSGSQVVNIEGQMLYEWQPSCEAWISNHKFNLAYEYADSPAMKITSDFSLYEPFDGRRLNFSSQRKRNGILFQELRGEADINSSEADFSKPHNLAYDLPAETVFPMFHSLNLLKSIKDNKRFYRSVMFDGSDEEGPVEINAFIGKIGVVKPKILSAQGVDQNLLKSPAKNVRLAFYPLSSQEEVADYEMSIVFHENGVISDMLIEYRDFSVTQTLLALEPLQSTCDAR